MDSIIGLHYGPGKILFEELFLNLPPHAIQSAEVIPKYTYMFFAIETKEIWYGALIKGFVHVPSRSEDKRFLGRAGQPNHDIIFDRREGGGSSKGSRFHKVPEVPHKRSTLKRF